jgi:hypothetical protein
MKRIHLGILMGLDVRANGESAIERQCARG